MKEEPSAGPSGSAAAPGLERVKLEVSEAEAEESAHRDDELGLVETGLGRTLRPVLRRCDEELHRPDGVQVSAITAGQHRRLGRVDATEMVTDFVKLEVEEHELEDDPAWTISEIQGSHTSTDSVHGRPYKTSSHDQCSRGRGSAGRKRSKTGGKPVDKCNEEGPGDRVLRLRTAHRTSISEVKTRLRAAIVIRMSCRAQQSKSQSDSLPGGPTLPAQRTVSAEGDTFHDRGRPTLSNPSGYPENTTPVLYMTGEVKEEFVGATTSSSSSDDLTKASFEDCSYNSLRQVYGSSHLKRRIDHDASTTSENGRKSSSQDIYSDGKCYRCHDCGKTFTLKISLTRHRLTHTGEKRYGCDDCGKMFTQQSHVIRHRSVHTGEKRHRCDDCGKTFARKGSLNRHRLIHTRERLYSCDNCGKTLPRQSYMISHPLAHTREKCLKCHDCGKTFTLQIIKSRYRLVHTEEKPFTCGDCGKAFARRHKMINHQFLHTGDKPHSCDNCGKAFALKRSLTKHLMTHSRDKPYTCDDCGKTFTHRSYMVRHRLLHTGGKHHRCEDCGETFTRLHNMIRHQLVHIEYSPVSCHYCEKTFRVKGNLKKHLKKHSGDNPYTCGVCRKMFVNYSNMITHRLGHTGGRPHRCGKCGKTFALRQNMMSHRLLHADAIPAAQPPPSRAPKPEVLAALLATISRRRILHSGA